MLDHERLDVYSCSIEFLALAFTLIQEIPRGPSIITDHLKRGAPSIPFNIAEGVAKMTSADKEKIYALSLDSPMECGSVLDAGHVLELISVQKYEEGKTLLNRIVSMLAKMCST